MNITCSAKACPVLLSAACVFYEGVNLPYTGINMNDNLQVALEKIDTKFNSLIDVNIYVSNGTITSNRTVTLNGKTLSFVGSSYTTIFQPAGTLQLGSLAGSGNRMVIADTNGVLGTQAIPLGTVTSVDMSVPTGFAISGNPVTTSGTLALAFASGYSLPTNSSQSNWDTAYNWVSNFPALVAGQYLTNNGTTLSWAAIDLSGYVPTARTLTINGTSYDLTANRSWSVGTVTSIVASTGITGGTITSSGTIAFDTTWGDARYQAIGSYVVTSRTLTINGTTYDLSADRTWSVGTVTSVAALTLGTTGTDVSSTVATGTTTPVITLNIPTASATNRGALSSTDWTTFNNKYDLPALTSGSVLFSNGTTIAQNNANLFWDNTNGRLGIGTNTPLYRIDINGTARVQDNLTVSKNQNAATDIIVSNTTNGTGAYSRFRAINNSSLEAQVFITSSSWTAYGALGGDTGGYYTNATNGLALLTDNNAPIRFLTGFSSGNTEKVRIFGSTGNVLIQNGGTFTDGGFRLDVNGTARVQGATTVTGIFYTNTILGNNFTNLSIEPGSSGSYLQLKSFANASSYVWIGDGSAFTHTSASVIKLLVNHSFAPTSGTGTLTQVQISPTINQTGGANGITRGLYVNPTLTAAADWRSIEWSNTTGWGLYGAGTANNYIASNLYIGTTTTSTAKLTVSGSSTATSALAQGVNLTNTLVAAANNDVLVGLNIAPTFTNGAFTGVTNYALRVTGASYTSGVINGGSNINLTNSGYTAYITKTHTAGGSGWGTIGFEYDNIILSHNSNGNIFYVNGLHNSVSIKGSVNRSSDTFSIQTTLTTGLGVYNSTGATSLFKVLSNGNILVGTATDAGFKLDVQGTGRFTGQLTTATIVASANCYISNSAYWFSYTSTGAGRRILGIDAANTFNFSTAGNGYVFANNNAAATLMTLTEAGLLLLGSSTSSGEKLQVTGDSKFTGTMYQNSASDALYNFQNGGANKWRIGNAFVAGANYFQLYDSVNSLERIRWNNNSTATFTSDFTFVGGSNAVATFQAAQPDVKIQATGGSNAVSLTFTPSNGFEGVIQNNVTNGFIQVKTASTIRVTFKNGGQVNFQPLAADPAGAGAGDVYYNSGTNKLRLYDGTSWVDLN
jgi:predicted heme/steroid binding protein